MAVDRDTQFLVYVTRKTTMQAGQIDMKGDIALILLGSNTSSGNNLPRSFVLNGRQQLLKALGIGADIFSGLYSSPAFPAGIGPDFVNAAMAIRTTLPPADLLAILHKIEAEAERTREVRWGPRTLDLDLIGVGDAVFPDIAVQSHWRNLPAKRQGVEAPTELILPHPRMQDRAFVLVPLAQVAPDWVHPVLGQSIVQMRDALPASDLAEIRPIGDKVGV
ncbi:2-amino-4-hydroxy-6-hydroxymethyldihydropteridine diphosphokinase [Loktanella sp. R86503]|uniref:2-amino-4-hydroxy-6- hydroxymethyldihydropteridine diphosphokinase n=1 Tax=Loktanella sp. R86503 TaxID=3093847 RepID=UPI0036DCD001